MKTKVVHSESKLAWNVVGTVLGGPYKYCRVPYIDCPGNLELEQRFKAEALKRAEFISQCFNNSEINF